MQRDYTYYSMAHKTYARLDHFLASSSLLPTLHNAEIAPRSLSDHALISVSLPACASEPTRLAAPRIPPACGGGYQMNSGDYQTISRKTSRKKRP